MNNYHQKKYNTDKRPFWFVVVVGGLISSAIIMFWMSLLYALMHFILKFW